MAHEIMQDGVAWNFFGAAKSYALASSLLARSISWEDYRLYALPYSHMVAQSIELALKAAYVAGNGDRSKLSRKDGLGHDLVKAASAARAQGFASAVDKDLDQCLVSLGQAHRENWYRYVPDRPVLDTARPAAVGPLLDRLIDDVEAFLEARTPAPGFARTRIVS